MCILSFVFGKYLLKLLNVCHVVLKQVTGLLNFMLRHWTLINLQWQLKGKLFNGT